MLKHLHRAAALLAPLAGLTTALAAGLLFCSLLAPMLGIGPWELLSTIGEGAWGGPESAAASLAKVTPLLLTGLAVSLAYQANLLNIGCEGQLTLGALTAATVSVAASSLPGFLLLPLTLLVGALAGGAWALPSMWLRQGKGVHEVITTLLMNYVAIYLAEYLVLGPLGDGTAMGRTVPMPAEATWRTFTAAGAGPVALTAAPIFALLLSLIAQVWLSRTHWGFEVMAVGSNPAAARTAGIGVSGWQSRLFFLSGAVAGLAGAVEVTAVHHRFYNAFSPGYGFDGITAAFLVNGAPGWLWLSALLLASLRAADKWLQLALNVSPGAILLLQAVMLLAVACRGRIPSMGRLFPSIAAGGKRRDPRETPQT